ncbi:MAG: hypothetical protein UHM23_06995, partial [Clostridia bacterium]|nr:hypothetical protein [Clostridia bacterium]
MGDFKYNDIICMQYPNPEIEKDFPDRILREAQFAPFAALTGYDEAIDETARQTDEKIELDEYEEEKINEKLMYLINSDKPEIVEITYFVRDKKKQGGRYITKSGYILKIREYEKDIIMEDGVKIPINDICAINCHM